TGARPRRHGHSRSDASAYDCVVRVFAPRLGIPEDLVTGSVQCTLAPTGATARQAHARRRAGGGTWRGGAPAPRWRARRIKIRSWGLQPAGNRWSGEIRIYRAVDGQIVEHWAQVDFLSLLQQIGALPAMG